MSAPADPVVERSHTDSTPATAVSPARALASAPATGDSASLAALRRRHMGANLSLHFPSDPLHIVRGRGSLLFDAEGRRYVDLVNNVAHVGHCHPGVVAAAAAQLTALNTNTRYLNAAYIQYATELAALFPAPLSVVYLVNSGSEANDLALRLARAHTGGSDVVCLDHAYHGHTQACIDISPYKFDHVGGRGKPPRTHVAPAPDAYRGRFRPAPGSPADATAVGAAYAETVAELCAPLAAAPGSNRGPRASEIDRTPASLCAFIAESYVCCGGQIALPPGYLAAAYAAVRAKGGVCIADEVQVGFGRVGSHMWAFELQGVVPDIVTLGKPIGNGTPLAAVVTTPAIAASFANGLEYFNTCGGATASAAVGRAVLRAIVDQRLQVRALQLGTRLMAALRARLQPRHAAVGDVRGHGLFLGVELVAPGPWAERFELVAPSGERTVVDISDCKRHGERVSESERKLQQQQAGAGSGSDCGRPQQSGDATAWRAPASAAASWVIETMRYKGFLLSTDGPYSSVLKLKPPMVVTARDLDAFVDALDTTLEEMALKRGDCAQTGDCAQSGAAWNVVRGARVTEAPTVAVAGERDEEDTEAEWTQHHDQQQ